MQKWVVQHVGCLVDASFGFGVGALEGESFVALVFTEKGKAECFFLFVCAPQRVTELLFFIVKSIVADTRVKANKRILVGNLWGERVYALKE